ncbi:MAG: hypothetical protein JWP14_401 [Frankiales bacterium]|nr:hypothetical protein [Frankiales bacterium]
MQRIHIDAKADHVLRLARLGDPAGAVAEIIWNGLDAEAQTVEVEVEVNEFDGVERVIVRDDGHGMPIEACASYFEGLGGSWKATAKVSPSLKRSMNGKSGQGRVRGFALGQSLTWTTVADATTERQRTTITARSASPTDYEIDGPVASDEPTGTIFEARLPAEKTDRLNADRSEALLTAEFAPFLASHPEVTILYRGNPLDPAKAQLRSEDYSLDSVGETTGAKPVLRVIEWPKDPGRELSLCDSQGVVLATVRPEIHAPGHHFTAYVMWDGFRDHYEHLALAEFESDEIAPLLGQARDQLREHFRNRDEQRRREQVERWRTEEVYPYADEAQTPPQKAEREVFDYVATTVARHLPKAQRPKRTTLRFLKEALALDPDGILPVIEEVFSLTKRDQEDLARLLNRTSLSNLIKASTHVANRLDFLGALRLMVFEPEISKKVRERSELHRILERETWVFGEQYALLVSDQSLDAVLARHEQVLGRKSKAVTPVRRADGRVGIVDMMLSQARRGTDRREHLVVELKAPKVKVGQKEVAQLKSYAQAVAADPQFLDTEVTWDFWVVSTEMDPVTRQDARQPNVPSGQIANWGNVRVWAKTWGEIIKDCEIRLNYYREHLDHDPSALHAQQYLNLAHGDLTPAPLKARTSA